VGYTEGEEGLRLNSNHYLLHEITLGGYKQNRILAWHYYNAIQI
jgi:hypothetical protein